VGERKGLVKCSSGAGLRPTDLNATTVRRITEGLRGVIPAVVQCLFVWVLRSEPLAIKLADCVLRISAEDNPAGIAFVAVDGQLKEFRAFMVARQFTLTLPVLQVCRRVEGDS